ncbi:DUF6340 family protein [Carboxylicivirga sp. M1479]|uniref:DUF6340 family protein n=1 Tax=Carboxylicivirga sp. M1479 TaxID=2594476 RepID=UPI001177DA30|nr:DUF6340 family protein [Carboxylicivirga sp. M1479]TRX65884.1 hypothetical protein FNN09_16475 [Carboxylicivirga sp. M1479]
MIRNRTTFFLLLLMMVAACKPYELMHYDVLRPATISIPPHIASVVLVNNAFPFNPDDAHIAHVVGEEVRLDTIRIDSFSTVVLGHLKAELDMRRFFDTVYIDTTHYNPTASGRPYRSLTPTQVDNICKQYKADAVLALAAAEYGTNVLVEDMEFEYFSTMAVNAVIFWRMYDGYSYEQVYSDVHRDTLYWSGAGEEINASVAGFPSMSEATIETGQYLGTSYVDQIVPYWEAVARKVYTSGSAQFVNAAEWLNNDNRFEAEKLWGFIFEHGNSREKGRAANNIALSMEARGELKLAMEWAYKSYQAFEMKSQMGSYEERESSKKLYLDMVRRYRDQKKLNEQLGVEL